jgi:hypothetical protein
MSGLLASVVLVGCLAGFMGAVTVMIGLAVNGLERLHEDGGDGIRRRLPRRRVGPAPA